MQNDQLLCRSKSWSWEGNVWSAKIPIELNGHFGLMISTKINWSDRSLICLFWTHFCQCHDVKIKRKSKQRQVWCGISANHNSKHWMMQAQLLLSYINLHIFIRFIVLSGSSEPKDSKVTIIYNPHIWKVGISEFMIHWLVTVGYRYRWLKKWPSRLSEWFQINVLSINWFTICFCCRCDTTSDWKYLTSWNQVIK